MRRTENDNLNNFYHTLYDELISFYEDQTNRYAYERWKENEERKNKTSKV